MKNIKIISLITIALMLSLVLVSAYTPIFGKAKTLKTENSNYFLDEISCTVGYYGYDCHKPVKTQSQNYNSVNYNNQYNGDYYDNYYMKDNNYYTQNNNYRVYNQVDKLYYPEVYDIKQYRIENSDYQERYVRTVNRCSTRDYTYPCDFYYGKIQ